MFSSLINMFNEVLTLSQRSDRNTSISEARLCSQCLRERIESKAARIAEVFEGCDAGWRIRLNQHEIRKIFIKSAFPLLCSPSKDFSCLFATVFNESKFRCLETATSRTQSEHRLSEQITSE